MLSSKKKSKGRGVDYPCLRSFEVRGSTAQVILFYKDSYGTVIWSDLSLTEHKVGYYSSTWQMENTYAFAGTIELVSTM